MEFNEKLQQLRKCRGLTQEELADALYVSRAAVSKWESGRGYPSLDSLKDISNFFSVSIDDLLSGEKLLLLAEKENKSSIISVCDRLFGMIDLFASMLIFLPIYPNKIDGFVYSVNLLGYEQAPQYKKTICLILFVLLVLSGVSKVILTITGAEKTNKILSEISVAVNLLAVLFLVVTRETYAAVFALLFLIAKAIIIFRCIRR